MRRTSQCCEPPRHNNIQIHGVASGERPRSSHLKCELEIAATPKKRGGRRVPGHTESPRAAGRPWRRRGLTKHKPHLNENGAENTGVQEPQQRNRSRSQSTKPHQRERVHLCFGILALRRTRGETEPRHSLHIRGNDEDVASLRAKGKSTEDLNAERTDVPPASSSPCEFPVQHITLT